MIHRRLRKGFSLLEVIIASAILVMTLAVVTKIQYQAMLYSQRASALTLGTQLAQEKLAEVQILIETEGIGTADITERGDFRGFGEDAGLEFGRSLDDYRWEYHVEEIDMALSGDVMGMMGGMLGGEDDNGASAAAGSAGGQQAGAEMLNQFGLGPDQMSEQLGQFVRRVRVRVYWGEENKAEEEGQEVILTTHIISPSGAFQQLGGGAAGPGGPGGGIPGQGGGPGGIGGAPGGGFGGRGVGSIGGGANR